MNAMSRPSPYHRLTVQAKQARQREAMREPAVPCPHCDAQTTPADLLRHVEACSGQRDPHPLSKWVTWGEAIELGVPEETFRRWVRRRAVRSRVRARPDNERRGRGRPARRVYLVRDVVKLMALRRRITPRDGGNNGDSA